MRKHVVAPLLISSFASLAAVSLGCAVPNPSSTNVVNGGAGANGSAGSNGGAGTNGGAGANGSAGSNGGAGTPGGTAGTPGGVAGQTGAAGAGGPACVPNPADLINTAAFNCDLATPIAIQGSVYAYGDGASCPFGPTSPPSNICTTGSCCISGTTVLDTTFAKWGCGIGVELNSSGGAAPIKSVYPGPVKCFNITLTGSSGGNTVRVGFTQSAMPTNQVSPYVEIAPFTNGWTGQVCFTDAECPSYAITAGTCTKAVGTAGMPFDLQIQVSAGSTATTVGAYNVCVSTIAPVLTTTGGGSTNSCSAVTGTGTITQQFGSAHVTCSGKDYIVQNNHWGTTAPQTITYGPGTKFKVTMQNENRTGNSTPAGYPSIFTGAFSGGSTAVSGLPRAVTAITTGSLQTSWTWASNGATGSYNATYDVWFSTSSAGDPSAGSPSGGFLMVWYHKPPENQPIGALVTTATLAGKTWNVWYGINTANGKGVVSYVAPQDITSLSFSLGDFINDAVGRTCATGVKCLQSSWFLTNVFSGFEIWNGGVGLETTDFALTVP
jgi:hypothetical protein